VSEKANELNPKIGKSIAQPALVILALVPKPEKFHSADLKFLD
jgi:hypothetical protein